jgi:amidophosphoribosyltransferase
MEKQSDFTHHPFDDDHLHEECGVFGIIGTQDAAAHTALGLHALQHRGQEAAGIVATDGKRFSQHMALGKVGENFNEPKVMDNLQGHAAIGHVRYSTSGEKANMANIQPLFAELDFGGFALAHNGNLTNAKTLKRILVRHGSIFRTTMDSEVMLHLVALSEGETVLDCLIDTLRQVEGAYSLVAITRDAVIGARDPLGVRPLVIGRLAHAHVLASETCALDIIGAEYVRDVEPGEIVILSEDNIQSVKPFSPQKQRFCIFEYVYFARPDSHVEGRDVYYMRKSMGKQLALENPVDADVVVPVPDSGVPAAVGYAEASRIPFELGIIRNHYVGRTFIEPTEQVRHFGVRLKHNANSAVLNGKKVILIDDSIVRGTTSKKIVQMVRDAGAKEVHMRISSPPTTHSCFYGVDTPSQDKLLAHRMSVKEMAEFIGVDSLSFLSVEGLYKAVGETRRNNKLPQFCDACFTGDYPIPIVDNEGAAANLPLLEPVSSTKA